MRSNQINIQYYKTMIGELILGSFEDRLCLLNYRYRKMRPAVDRRITDGLDADYVERDSRVIDNTRSQLEEYLDGKRQNFDIEISMVGSRFQRRVWKALGSVKYGDTISYQQLAKNIDNEKAVRAVASANAANAISIIIPCHRIIGSNGKLVGYGGGLPVKKHLLKLEEMNRAVHIPAA